MGRRVKEYLKRKTRERVFKGEDGSKIYKGKT